MAPGSSTVVDVIKEWLPGIDARVTTVRHIGSPKKLAEVNITRTIELIIDGEKHPLPVEPYKNELTYIGSENEVPRFLSNASTGRTRHDSKPWEDSLYSQFIELVSADEKEFKKTLEEEYGNLEMPERAIETRLDLDQVTF